MRATAIVPVKRFRSAKRRLGDAIEFRERRDVLEAMLGDVLAALGRAESLERLVVITGERRAERIALEAAKRMTLTVEVLRDPDDEGHSQAATLGIIRALAMGAKCVALLPGDCPLLDPAELDSALADLKAQTVTVIPDRHGTGTNGLIMSPPDAIGPAFGPGSCERHLELAATRGFSGTVKQLESLALDLDTPDDLEQLQELLRRSPQLAPRTAKALVPA